MAFNILVATLFCLLSASALAAEGTIDTRCETGARQIAAAYGSEGFEKWLGNDFPNRDAVLVALRKARSEGDTLRLDLISVEGVQIRPGPKPGSEECVARVRTRVMASKKGATERRVGPIGTSNWRILLSADMPPQPIEPKPEDWLLGSHWGRVLLRVYWILPVGKRDALLTDPKAKEVGLQPTDVHPQAVVFPDRHAEGFYVRLGDQQTMVSEDGRFALDVTDKSPKEGQVINPGNGQVVATFSTSSLVPAKGNPAPILVELAMLGECGMDHGDGASDPACHGLGGPQP